MPRYLVEMPIVGTATLEVEADNQEAAITAFYARFHESENEADVDWEFRETISEGNVLHAPLNEVSVSLVKKTKGGDAS